MKKLLWYTLRFSGLTALPSMYYFSMGTYRDLPRSWEIIENIYMALGRRDSIRARWRDKWVVRNKAEYI